MELYSGHPSLPQRMVEESNTPKVEEIDPLAKVAELAAEVDKSVATSGRLSPEFLRETMQGATDTILAFRNDLLEGMGEEPGINPIDADKRLEDAYAKRLTAAEVPFALKADFKPKTPYWAYLKQLADAI